jgi:cell division protein FtsB
VKKFFKKIPQRWMVLLRNKYFLAGLSFLIWMIFFDRNDFVTQYQYRKKLNDLRKEQQYYIDEININRVQLQDILGNPKNLEKFAREQYRMKKDNEEVFVVLYSEPEKK